MDKIIVIPDVHGRTFWKDIVKDNENADIIFLGDYVDPYDHENILPEEVIFNFKEIIEFKKSHMDNVTLLLGNHDFGGYVNDEMPKCRFDWINAPEIQRLFRDNINLFKLIVFRNINNKNVSFSHSVMTKGWIGSVKELKGKNINDIANLLNSAVETNNQELLTNCLYLISRYRGGWGIYGSVVWADVCEANNKEMFPDTIDYQIFGHSQQRYEPIITDTYACLDIRQGFIINENGHIINNNLNIDKEI